MYTNGGSYSLQAEFTDPGAAYPDFFGSTVAIVNNATVVVSAPFENDSEGAVFEYTESGSTWQTTPTQTMTDPGGLPLGSNGYGDIFGEGLAVDGSTIVIGAPGDPGATDPVPANCNTSASAGCSSGAVYMYEDVRHTWTEEARLTASNGKGCSATCSSGADAMGGDYFGIAVAIKSKTVAIGAAFASIPPASDGGTSDAPNSTGTAYVFTGSGSSWTQQAELYDPAEVTNGGQDWFGYKVAVATASSVVVTAPYDPEGNATGAAFVFGKQGSSWATYPTELTALDGTSADYLGYYALATSGSSYVYVGGNGPTDSGDLYIFKK
jgi:hypothetical protein